MPLTDYWLVLRRHFLSILLVTAAATATAYTYSQSQHKVYSSTAKVLIQLNQASNLTGLSTQNTQEVLGTQAELARVPGVAQAVLEHTGLAKTETTDWFLAHSHVSTSTDSDVISFTFEGSDPAQAQLLATEYARQFMLYRKRLLAGSVSDALKQLNQQVAHIGRAAKTNPALLTDLLDQISQLRTLNAVQISSVNLVQEGNAAGRIAPNPVRDGILGLVLGLVLGIAAAFLSEALDTRLRSADEISRRLELPLLGRLPPPPRRRSRRLVMLEGGEGSYGEAIRGLRTSFSFALLKQRPRVIAVTSAVGEEGKTTTVANLAIALARGGMRVVLVDLDLHRPELDRLFHLRQQPGLTDVALGNATLAEALAPIRLPPRRSPTVVGRNGTVHEFQQGTLEILVSGPTPPDPGEFVGTEFVHHLLRDLRDRCNIVLVDAPPLLVVADTLTLTPSLDAAILVARLKTLRRPALAELERMLSDFPVPRLGLILTDAEVDESYSYLANYSAYAPMRGHKRLKEPIA